jgi:hypothetical protein
MLIRPYGLQTMHRRVWLPFHQLRNMPRRSLRWSVLPESLPVYLLLFILLEIEVSTDSCMQVKQNLPDRSH